MLQGKNYQDRISSIRVNNNHLKIFKSLSKKEETPMKSLLENMVYEERICQVLSTQSGVVKKRKVEE
jgi:hypothetical protein